MPNATLKAFSTKYNIPISKLEKDWEFAKKETEDNFGVKEKDFKDRHFAYAMGILKNVNKIKESITKEFLESKLDSKTFLATLKENVTSSSFSGDVDKPIIKKDDEEEELKEEVLTDFAMEDEDKLEINSNEFIDLDYDGTVEGDPDYNINLEVEIDNDSYEKAGLLADEEEENFDNGTLDVISDMLDFNDM